nr:SART-1 family protein DOT2-like [Ipomoea batatas]GMD54557.1 SART-1 family protein DOT2-like [Ipomoea batatas]
MGDGEMRSKAYQAAAYTKAQEAKSLVTDEEDEEAVLHEAAVGKGLCRALRLLKQRGALKETIQWGAPNMDNNKSSKEIHIERTDEHGRILTPKEAFRLFSHKFHGKRPSKLKQEKRMRQFNTNNT